MAQDKDNGLSPEEQDRITDRILEMLAEVPTPPAPTEFGDALRALADRVDTAPALWTAKLSPNQPARVTVLLTTGAAVRTLAADLGATVTEAHDDRELITYGDLDMGLVELHLFAYDEEPREVRRPTDVTPTIEAVES